MQASTSLCHRASVLSWLPCKDSSTQSMLSIQVAGTRVRTQRISQGARRGLRVCAAIDYIPLVPPNTIHIVQTHVQQASARSLPSFLSLADVSDAPTLQGAAEKAADALQAAAQVAAETPAAAEAAKEEGGGFLDGLAYIFESFLKVLDNGLEQLSVPYSYGFAIILLTILVKVATYPLSKSQVESTLSMQALQPRVRELQAKYKNDQEKLQLETARVYREAGVNPLAGCLPTLATIPVFIGLYKALSNVANEGLLTEGFFFIPSLGGPTTLAMQEAGGGLSWLFPFKDGAPPVGWHDAGAYLILPLLLVASQYLSQKIISPPQQSNDPTVQQTQAILGFLPLLIGWFSLNVPSGLSLYWLTNNIITTGQQLYLRNAAKANVAAAEGATITTSTSTAASSSSNGVADQEAEVSKPSGKDLDARGKKKKAAAAAEEPASASSNSGKGKRGEKFRQVKAREAARKAAAQAASAAATVQLAPSATDAVSQAVAQHTADQAKVENGTPATAAEPVEAQKKD